jgi:hypothetical protein
MADRTIKRGSTGVILHIPVANPTTGTPARCGDGDNAVTVMETGGTAATTYDDAGSKIEDITTLGTYQAPSATKIRMRNVTSSGYGLAITAPIWEVHLPNALFAVAGSGLTISIASEANGVTATYTVALSDLNVAAGEANLKLIDGGTALPQISAEGFVSANLVQVEGEDTIDGAGILQWFKMKLAWMLGKVTKTGTDPLTLTFKEQDGTTTSFSVDASATDGTRSAGGTIP